MKPLRRVLQVPFDFAEWGPEARVNSPTGYAPTWTAEERAAYKQAWRERVLLPLDCLGGPVLLARAEHDHGECDHCDLLRQLQREAEDE